MIDNIVVLQDLCKKVGIEYSTTAWSVEQFIDFSRKCYEQGRADAFEEFEAKIKECCSIAGSFDYEDMERIKEQLKR